MEQQEAKKTESAAPSNKKKKNPIMQFFAGLLGIIILAVLGVFVYTKSQVKVLSTAPFVMQAASALRVPVAKIEGNPVLYTEFIMDMTSLKHFYASQPEGFPVPTENDVKEQVLSRLFINALIEDLADEYNIVITEDDIAEASTEMLSQFPDEATAVAEINKTFGWSLETFTNRVIIPIVLEQKVAEAFTTDEDVDSAYTASQVKARHILFIPEEGNEAEARQSAQAVLERIKNGEDFAELAKEFGADGTAEAGGDLGWIDRGVTVPAFEEILFSLQPGELYGEVAETEFGYHIVKADEVRSINDFPLYFQERLNNAEVKIYTDITNPFAVPPELPSTVEDELADDAMMEQ